MTIGVVAIGRNEGERLISCLRSAAREARRVVYVDSGSTDGSPAAARALGVEVVELDMTIPFTAARARNAGARRLLEDEAVTRLQFVDGDCDLQPGWLGLAAAALDEDAGLGIVTGWRSEKRRDASVYNMLCDVEWRRPAGEIDSCGGDMMVRRAAYETVGGFNPVVIAAEDDEFCKRVRNVGWRIRRLPAEMTRHDAAMTRFAEWWRRMMRAGHGFAQVGALHPDYFVRERRRVWIWGGALPLAAVLGAVFAPWLLLLVAALYGASFARSAAGLRRRRLSLADALPCAFFFTISKFPNIQGMLLYWRSRLRRQSFRLIEYK